MAFASFTFDSRSPGSVLIVPEVAFGRSGGRWFVTTVGDADHTRYLTAVLHTEGDPAALVGPARRRLRAVAPTVPGTFRTVDGSKASDRSR